MGPSMETGQPVPRLKAIETGIVHRRLEIGRFQLFQQDLTTDQPVTDLQQHIDDDIMRLLLILYYISRHIDQPPIENIILLLKDSMPIFLGQVRVVCHFAWFAIWKRCMVDPSLTSRRAVFISLSSNFFSTKENHLW